MVSVMSCRREQGASAFRMTLHGPKDTKPGTSAKSMREILSSGLLKQVKPGSTLMADGATAWSADARTLSMKRFTVHHVKHSRA